MEFIFFALLFILGASIGSFLNVLVYRIPRNESFAKGRSYCEFCHHTLAWYDLIPLFSFLQLQGKCRYCHKFIGFDYLVVEIVTGLLFVLTVSQLKITNYELRITDIVSILYYVFITASFIVIFFTDLKYGIIPDKILFPTFLIIITYQILNTRYLILDTVLSALGTCLFFFMLFVFTKGRGMGFGDVKLSFVLGLILGFPAVIIALYIAFLTGGVVSLILILWGKKKFHGSTIAFGPFLIFGAYVALFWTPQLVNLYFSTFVH